MHSDWLSVKIIFQLFTNIFSSQVISCFHLATTAYCITNFVFTYRPTFRLGLKIAPRAVRVHVSSPVNLKLEQHASWPRSLPVLLPLADTDGCM